MKVEEIKLLFKNNEQKFKLSVVDDIKSLIKKADTAISQGKKQAANVIGSFSDANDSLGQADRLLLKAQAQAEDLGAKDVLKELSTMEKKISSEFSDNMKIISALKSI